jgi:hypothetical protein
MGRPRSRKYCLLALAAARIAFADRGASIAGCAAFPDDNIWNTPVDRLAVAAASADYVATIGPTRSLVCDFGSGTFQGGPIGIPFVTVTATQPKLPATFLYGSESDPGPYAVPLDAPIEGGSQSGGDRHAIALDSDNCILYELYRAFPGADRWRADSGAIFDLKSHRLRPATWTSADAAGLPILPGLVRYEEVLEGEIRHAIRFTAPQTRRAYVWPARHFASSLTDPKYPPMGQRFRLKATFGTSGFSPEGRVILAALAKYGMILADNGSAWFVSGAPDERWNNDRLRELRRVQGSDFEAVDVSSLMIDPDSGQARQPGAPLDFAQVALGGGYTTRFTLVNTGGATVDADLRLTGSDGRELAVLLDGISAGSTIRIPAGGVAIVSAAAPQPGAPLATGWARFATLGGSLDGVATFRFVQGGTLRGAAGVLPSSPARKAVIPIDNDAARGRYTGYAIANIGATDLRISLKILDGSGATRSTLAPAELNPLGAGRQVARFLHQDDPLLADFKGSVVLTDERDAEFAAVALVAEMGQLAALPVIHQ